MNKINNKEKVYTNVLQMVDRDPNERAYVANLLIELLLLYIEIVTIASQLVGTHLYLFHIFIHYFYYNYFLSK